MVHPVRSVGEEPFAVQYLLLDAPLAVRWRLARLGRIYVSWHCLALVLALLERAPGAVRVAGSALPCGPTTGPPPCDLPELTCAITRRSGHLSPVERWQAWPARKPFADEVDRWWPSQEPPPIQHEPQPQGLPIRPVPEFPLYPAHAGLFNVFA
jgi:hypothetical protein